MKVKDLIKALKKMPQDAAVCFEGDDEPSYIGSMEMQTLGGHGRLDDGANGGFVDIANIKKHRAVVLKAHEWGELGEPSIVKWTTVEPQELDNPDFYKRLREACV